MKSLWLNRVFPIAGLFSFRMLGLFMLIPVFTVNATQLNFATPTLIGIALGAYGLSQGLLQIPFGLLSDRFGRKPLLTLGFILFAIGSLLGALTHSIYGMILARILQGSGAIGSVLIALLADLTPDEQRTKAMAVIGATIGLSFGIAMVLGPSLVHAFGLSGLFFFTAFLAGLGLLSVHILIPTPQQERFHADTEARPDAFWKVLSNPHLQRLNIGIFCQHLILTATFYAIPFLLQDQLAMGHLSQQWHFYLPLMVFSFIAMMPCITFAERRQRVKTIFITAVAVTVLSQGLLMLFHFSWPLFCTFMFTYFVAFNLLEASLPSLVSKQADPNSKGTAMGIYSSSQFLGIFAGGCLSGVLYQYWGPVGIFLTNTFIGLFWLLMTLPMKPNIYMLTVTLHIPSMQNTQAVSTQLKHLQGVHSVFIVPEENLIYLRVHKEHYRPGSAEKALLHF
jgi:MFS family permease